MPRLLILLSFSFSIVNAQPKPTAAQLAWHEMEFYLFVHFGPNTFTDVEWGHGNEKEEIFNPSGLDCNQWCRTAKAAGAAGIIITAKHHDGFCLWPSKFSKHTVRESKWKNGKGDVLKELSAACKRYGLKFGVYLSPWDRNHPDYGTDKYNDVFVNMLKEIFTHYGPVWELWWDGANGEGPNGKRQLYDWHRFESIVRKLSPRTIIFSDIGPDIRWCGNEDGIAGTTNWNYLDTAGFKRGAGAPPQDTLNSGNANGHNWIPAECDVSIRPGWFWHEAEDHRIKTPKELFQLYLKSVGRGANLLLNVPPDNRGLITTRDSLALTGFKKLREANLSDSHAVKGKAYIHSGIKLVPATVLTDRNNLTAVKFDDASNQTIQLRFAGGRKINCVVIREDIMEGQTVGTFILKLKTDEGLKSYRYTTIGHKRIITFPAANTEEIELQFQQANAIGITEITAYLINDALIEQPD